MAQAAGFVHQSFTNYVYHLQKSLYGFKQAPGEWYMRLYQFLMAIGFYPSKAYTSLLVYRDNAITIYLLVYVDDIIITRNHPFSLKSIILNLGAEFSIRDFGCLSLFLGVEVTHKANGLYLSKRRFI